MDDFEQLKNVWQQQPSLAPAHNSSELKKNNADNQRKLERSQLISAVLLLLTSVFLIWMGFFSGITFQSRLTYVAIILLAIIPTLQGIINLSVYRRLRLIDITAPVAQHLAQWEHYYEFRKLLIRFNMPLYYLFMNGAFGLYFIEILGYFSWVWRIVALAVYIAWMLYAYFVLGKKVLQKEQARLETIISNMRAMQDQLTDRS